MAALRYLLYLSVSSDTSLLYLPASLVQVVSAFLSCPPVLYAVPASRSVCLFLGQFVHLSVRSRVSLCTLSVSLRYQCVLSFLFLVFGFQVRLIFRLICFLWPLSQCVSFSYLKAVNVKIHDTFVTL